MKIRIRDTHGPIDLDGDVVIIQDKYGNEYYIDDSTYEPNGEPIIHRHTPKDNSDESTDVPVWINSNTIEQNGDKIKAAIESIEREQKINDLL